MSVQATVEVTNGRLIIDFPEKVLSTNVSELKDHIFAELELKAPDPSILAGVNFVFERTKMVDSLGLNLLVMLIDWSDSRNLAIRAQVANASILKVFESVWLTQRMEIS